MMNPWVPHKLENGYWKMVRKEPTPAERQAFIVEAMKIIIEKGSIVFTADPDRIPSKVFQHTDMMGVKRFGTWHTWLEMETQKLNIGMKYADYDVEGRDSNQVYMSIRVDVEKVVDLFDNLEIRK